MFIYNQPAADASHHWEASLSGLAAWSSEAYAPQFVSPSYLDVSDHSFAVHDMLSSSPDSDAYTGLLTPGATPAFAPATYHHRQTDCACRRSSSNLVERYCMSCDEVMVFKNNSEFT